MITHIIEVSLKRRRDPNNTMGILLVIIIIFVGVALMLGALSAKIDNSRSARGIEDPCALSKWIDSGAHKKIEDMACRARRDNWKESVVVEWIRNYENKGYDVSPLKNVLKEREDEYIAFAESPAGQVLAMSGHEFEHWVAGVLKANGWKADVTPASNDGGIDIIAQQPEEGGYSDAIAIQCKHYKKPVGVAHIRQLQGARGGYTYAMMIATNGLTQPAYIEAKENQIVVLTLNDLLEMMS